jgi:hypothetical protein
VLCNGSLHLVALGNHCCSGVLGTLGGYNHIDVLVMLLDH